MQDVFHNLCLGYMHSMLHHSSNSLGISTAFMQEVNRSTHLHDTVQLDARETPALALPSTREHAEVQQRIQQLPHPTQITTQGLFRTGILQQQESSSSMSSTIPHGFY